MDRGLKERLIGAVVLVVLGVWLIPWVLNGPEQDSSTKFGSLGMPSITEQAPLKMQIIRLDNDRDRANPTSLSTSQEIKFQSPDTVVSTRSFFIQLDAFADPENARRLAERVKDSGFDPQISAYSASNRVMHRVRIGPYSTPARAEGIVSSLSAHGFPAQVVLE